MQREFGDETAAAILGVDHADMSAFSLAPGSPPALGRHVIDLRDVVIDQDPFQEGDGMPAVTLIEQMIGAKAPVIVTACILASTSKPFNYTQPNVAGMNLYVDGQLRDAASALQRSQYEFMWAVDSSVQQTNFRRIVVESDEFEVAARLTPPGDAYSWGSGLLIFDRIRLVVDMISL